MSSEPQASRIKTWFLLALSRLWDNFDSVLSIAISGVAAWWSTFGGKQQYAVAATALALGVLAFGAIKDRIVRDQIKVELNDVRSIVNRLLQKVVADDFFSRKTSERDLIVVAEKELILVQETGRLIAETCRQDLLNFLRRGGRIRWVAVCDDEVTAQSMALRNANLTTTDLMIERMRSGVKMIEVLAREAGAYSSHLEIRFLAYPMDITAVVCDPSHEDFKRRRALVRLQGYQVNFDEKLDFQLNAYDSRLTFNLYRQQIENYWHSSTKCIFLTGQPRIGKSTLLERVVSEITSHGIDVIGFITRDIRNGNRERIGFETKTINGDTKGRLATKLEDGSYELNEETMTTIVLPTIREGLGRKGSVLVVDEIGPIQLGNVEFQKLVGAMMENRSISILGIVAAEGHIFLEKIRQHIRSSVIEVTAETRMSLEEGLVAEFVPRQ